LLEIPGAFVAIWLQSKYGVRKTMFWGALMSIPFIVSLNLAAYKAKDMTVDTGVLSNGFVYTWVMVLTIVNGFGQGIT
jgi:hypothetical protein